MSHCQRCEDRRSWDASDVVLAGEVFATLCGACRTEWAGRYQASSVARQECDLNAELAWFQARGRAGQAPGRSEYLAAFRDRQRLLLEAREMALAFVQPKKEEAPPCP